MAVVKNVSYKGNKSISTLSGQIRLEQNRGRLVVYDANAGNELNVLDTQGFKVFDDDDNELLRAGRQPDNSINLAVAESGNDIKDAF